MMMKNVIFIHMRCDENMGSPGNGKQSNLRLQARFHALLARCSSAPGVGGYCYLYCYCYCLKHLAMVVQQENSFCANGDNHCVLQGVIDNLCHLIITKMMTVTVTIIDFVCTHVNLVKHVALGPENFAGGRIFPNKSSVACHESGHIPEGLRNVLRFSKPMEMFQSDSLNCKKIGMPRSSIYILIKLRRTARKN